MNDLPKKKIQYFSLCSSVSLGGKSLYAKREEEENPDIKKDNQVWKMVGSEYDSYRINQVFNKDDFPNYTQNGKLVFTSQMLNLITKEKVLFDLQTFFDETDFDASLLIMSGVGGHSLNKGVKEGFIIVITKKGDEHITYSEILDLWLSRKSAAKNKHLLIVLDIPGSGSWVTENLMSQHYDSVSIQASSGEDQVANDVKNQGGILIHNFLEANRKKSDNVIHKSKTHNPTYIGSPLFALEVYGLNVLYNNWNHFESITYTDRDFIGDKYKGMLLNNAKNGLGMMKFQNREEYYGEWANDLKQGFGLMFLQNGDFYAGFWKNNLQHGMGAYTYSNGNKYLGEFVLCQRTGKGKYIYMNGNVYTGEFKDDQCEGQGILKYKSGNVYEGHFVGGKKNGKGVYTFVEGGRYDGEFKNDKFEGKGIYSFSNGNVYDGEFKDGKKEGQGTFKYHSGNLYKGMWKQDKIDGFGIFYYRSQDVYEGEFKNSLFDGRGIYTYKNGDRYDGEWKQDKKIGKGTFYYKNGDKFEGIFANGKRNGDGVYTSADGKLRSGVWKDDEYVK